MNRKALVCFVSLIAVMLTMMAIISSAEERTCNHENTLDVWSWSDWNSLTYVSIDNATHSVTGEYFSAIICSDCWIELSRSANAGTRTETEPHQYVNGICEQCGHQNTCSHENTDSILESVDRNKLVYESIDNIHHYVTGEYCTYVICYDCGAKLSPVENAGIMTLEEPHTYLDDICILCGQKNTCSHGNTIETWYWANWNNLTYEPFDEKTHNVTGECYTSVECIDCGIELSRSPYTSSKTVQYNHVFDNGKCRDCGYEKTCSHEKTEEISGRSATCMETGLTTGKKCSVCGKVLVEQNVITALGHDWDEGKITKEATSAETGIKTYTCKRCGEIKTEEVPYEPKTNPKYSIKDTSFDKDEMLVSGSIVHDASTETVTQVYARVTFFLSDGTFVVTAAVVGDDGTFEAICSGDVIHVAIRATNSARIRPGDYNTYGTNEFDVE